MYRTNIIAVHYFFLILRVCACAHACFCVRACVRGKSSKRILQISKCTA